MNLFREQIELEKSMVQLGVDRYYRQLETLKESEMVSEAPFSKYITKNYIEDVASYIEELKKTKKRGVGAKYLALLRNIDSTQASLIGIKGVLDGILRSKIAVVPLAKSIGRKIEDQIRFSHFHKSEPAFYEAILKDFNRKNTTKYEHKHKVLLFKFNERFQWNSWTSDEQVHLGVMVLNAITQATGLIRREYTYKRGRPTNIIIPNEELIEFITKYNESKALLEPDLLPCVIEPDDWVDIYNGGYRTAELRSLNPFIKSYNKAHNQSLNEHNRIGGYDRVLEVANKLQKTPWSVNEEILDVAKEVWSRDLRIGMPPSTPLEVPPSPIDKGVDPKTLDEETKQRFKSWKRLATIVYTEEKERIGKTCQIVRIIQLATRMSKYNKFYYVYKADFRGRLYPMSPTFNPQGTDLAKGLLKFGEGLQLGERGAYWLAVHGANVYGNDKVSLDDRYDWIKENEDVIIKSAGNPLSETFWRDADKPYQFLAFCMEWRDYCIQGDTFRSHLPIAMDGSCNGIQHFSAILRDEEGAKTVNLLDSDVPNDIYQKVANRVEYYLKGILPIDTNYSVAQEWLDMGITRKLTKKPVMTLPYGSTMFTARESVDTYVRAVEYEFKDIKQALTFFVPILWKSIHETVVSARGVMNWFRDTSKILSKSNSAIEWVTPMGFKCFQKMVNYTTVKIQTELCGFVRLNVGKPSEHINSQKQLNGISPNFVHSMDASHLCMTVLNAPEINDWAMVHDSYASHACNTDKMNTAIRNSFFELYNNNDPIEQYREHILSKYDIELPSKPATGSYEIGDVLNAKYFFA